MNNSLVKRASDAYRKGNFKEACALYQQAASVYGEKLFSVNIRLCHERLQTQIGQATGVGKPSIQKIAEEALPKKGIEKEPDEPVTPPILFEQEKDPEKKLKALYILDPISEASWSKQFKLIPLGRNSYKNQIKSGDFNFVFLESCWKGNSGEWEYAFVSPGFKHANAVALVDAIKLAMASNVPVVFWNKEDPMHYEKFLPIAKLCSHVFTTDSELIGKYKQDLGHDRVGVLGFGADPMICNPLDRFRNKSETVCFAGAFYPEHHDERVRQMLYVLPAVNEYKGAIYDRYSDLDTDRYRFPEQFQPFIRRSVPFDEIVKVYKKFKVFLNVNTIINSPTMMSRRVYELLASGTPVVSAPSKALEKQFPGIVLTANDEAGIKAHVGKLLSDEGYWDRISHLGYRTVFNHYTYGRNRYLVEELLTGEKRQQEAPLVSIIVASCRPINVQRTIENVTRQNHTNLEVIYVVTPNFTVDDREKLLSVTSTSKNIKNAQVLIYGNDVTLGRCLNQAIKISSGKYIAKFDDDNFYFANYVSDMLIPFSFDDYAVVGKEGYYCYLGGFDKLIWRYPERRHRTTQFVAGDAMIIKREIFEATAFPEKRVGEDTKLLKDIVAKGGRIYSADHFNFIKYRGADQSQHTWLVEEEKLMKGSIIIKNGLDTEIVQC